MRTKSFSIESWSWSSFFSSSGADFQRTATICVERPLGGNLGHGGHRLFLSHLCSGRIRKQGAAKGGRQKEFGRFFVLVFGTLSVTFWSLFLMLLSALFATFLPNSFCRTPFAAR